MNDEMEYKDIVDRAEHGKDWINGYLNGEHVISYRGVSDISLVELYDKDGNRVIPVPAPLDDSTIVQLCIAEILETNPSSEVGVMMMSFSYPGCNSTAVAELYARLIKRELKTIDNVPDRWKDEVQQLLNIG